MARAIIWEDMFLELCAVLVLAHKLTLLLSRSHSGVGLKRSAYMVRSSISSSMAVIVIMRYLCVSKAAAT